MRLLFIDHDDSFSENLASFFKERVSTLIVVNSRDLSGLDTTWDGVIFSPGPGHPKDYPNSLNFLSSLPSHTPVLGVCLGFQLLLHEQGRRIARLPFLPVHGRKVCLDKTQSKLMPSFSYQGQIVLYNSLGNFNEDLSSFWHCLGYENQSALIIEHKHFPRIGVQYHPESFASSQGNQFLEAILQWMKKGVL